MLRVLGKASSINVRKVLWTCDELGVPYDREDWGSGFASTDKPEFLVLNPNAMVPVVVDERGALWESNTICRYLAAKANRVDLLPADLRARALVEQWMDWQASELNPAWSYAFRALVRNDPSCQDSGLIAASIASWTAKMRILDNRLAETRAFVCGPAFTLADVALGLSVNRWLMTPSGRSELSAVTAYFGRLLERPAFRRHGGNGLP